MTDKQLRGYTHIVKRIYECHEEIKKHKTLIATAREVKGLTISDMPRGNEISNPTAMAAESIVYVFENQLLYWQKYLADWYNQKKEIDEFMDSLDPVSRLVLTLRYCNQHNWAEIALKSKYSIKQCQRISKSMLE